jgi:hypothetical protein
MKRGTVLPDTAEVELGFLRPKDRTIQMHLRACRVSAVCPECQTISSRVHSRYSRELGALPWEGIPVRIYLQTRKFFCGGKDCRRRIFTERLPNTVLRYARRTRGSPEALDWISLGFRQRGWHAHGASGPWLDPAAATAAEIQSRRHIAGSTCSWHRRLALAQGQATAPFCATWRRTGWSIFAGSGERDRSHAFGCGDRQPGLRQRLCRSSPKDCAASGPGGRSLAPLAQPERGTLQPHQRILTQTTHTIRASEAPPSAVPHAEPRACHNATQLWREIRERGFHGRQSIERTWIRQRRGPRYQPEAHAITAPPLRTSPRHTAWLILTEPTAARPYLEELYRRSPEIAATASVAREFFRIVRTRDSTAWPSGFNLGDRTGQLRRPPHPRSGRGAGCVADALEQRSSRRTGPSTEAGQPPDVRPCQLRSARVARPQRGLNSTIATTPAKLTQPSPNVRMNPNQNTKLTDSLFVLEGRRRVLFFLGQGKPTVTGCKILYG